MFLNKVVISASVSSRLHAMLT